ncbi:MAG: Xaa-Pro peptidase family protein [Solirubrobacteraceae bacterium]
MTLDTTSPLQTRLDRLRSALNGASVDAIALSPSDNLRHTIGFSPLADERFCALLVTASAEAFVVPQLNADQTEAAVPGLPIFRWKDEDGAGRALAEALARVDAAELRRVAVDPEMRAEALLALLDAAPALSAVNGAGVMRTVRETKEAGEIEVLTRSAAIADEAMRRAIAACRLGVTEYEVAAAASTAFNEAGAEERFVAVGSGPNGAFPHHEVSRRVLEDGDPVVIDLGGKLDSYWSDLTRMAVVGEPSSRYREVHDTVEAAVQAALAAARPGATCGDVDRAARGVIEDAGYGEHFLHRTGHGLGLSVHEAPWIMAGEPTPLRAGMVFSIEPGIYLEREFGIRLEEIVHLAEDGPRIFSGLPRTVRTVST